MFNDNFFEDIRIVREEADCEEALRRLANYPELTRIAVFWGNSWEVVSKRVTDRNPGIPIVGEEAWENMVLPAMFLVAREMPEELWQELLNYDLEAQPQHHEHSRLYKHIRNKLRIEIEKYLFDGTTMFQDVTRNEEEWPMEYDKEAGELVPYDPIAPNNIEEEALDNILAHEIMSELSEKDIEILTADHGEGPELAEKYNMSEEAIRKRRERLVKRLREKYDG